MTEHSTSPCHRAFWPHQTEFVRQSGEHGSRRSTEQVAEFAERLRALIAEYFAPGRGDRTGTNHGLHRVFTPVDLHPLADS